jgi:hypothetical protein
MVGRTLDWKGEVGRWLKPLSSLPQSERRLDFFETTPQRFCFRLPTRSSSVCSSAGRQTHVLQCRLPADWRTTKVAVCSTPSWTPPIGMSELRGRER